MNLILNWARDQNRHPIKEDTQMTSKRVKTCSTSYITRDCKLKQQYHSTSVRVAKMCFEDTKCWPGRVAPELSFTAAGNAAPLEGSPAVSSKMEHALPTESGNRCLWYLGKWTEGVCTQRTLHTDVYRSLVLQEVSGTSRQWRVIQCWEETRCQAMKESQMYY